jgi:hypothetical protein
MILRAPCPTVPHRARAQCVPPCPRAPLYRHGHGHPHMRRTPMEIRCPGHGAPGQPVYAGPPVFTGVVAVCRIPTRARVRVRRGIVTPFRLDLVPVTRANWRLLTLCYGHPCPFAGGVG